MAVVGAVVVVVVLAAVLAVGALAGCTSPTTSSATPAPTLTATHPGAPWPTAGTTGSRADLRVHEGDLAVTTAGTVIADTEIRGSVRVDADRVTLRNVRITSTDYWPLLVAGSKVTVEDATIVGGPGSQASVGDQGGSNVFRRLDLSGGQDGIKLADHSALLDSYVHDLAQGDGAHNDGVEVNGTVGIKVVHNTVVNRAEQTSAIFIGGKDSASRDIAVTDNLVAGGGYAIYGPVGAPGAGPSSNVRVVDNVISTRFFAKGGSYGPVAYWEAGRGNDWSGNIWFDGPDRGRPVPPS